MKSLLILLLGIACGVAASAQTRMIAHKSHSGSMENYKAGQEAGWSDVENSNFGLYTIDFLDTVIRVNDTSTVLVRSSHLGSWKRAPISQCRDTVYNHPQYTGKSVEKMKSGMKKNPAYDNHVDSVKFIGFEKENDKKKNNILPVSATGSRPGPGSGSPLVLIFMVVALVSVVTGWVYYKYEQLKHSI